jgi:RimK family alpha-L-glutamate ligase
VRVTIVGHRRGSTSDDLVAAWRALGIRARMLVPEDALDQVSRGEVVLSRLDVLETLDGIEPGLDVIAALADRGAVVLNRPSAIHAAHDKLETALRLKTAGLPHPRTTHLVRPEATDGISLPVVVKPRYGSWGRDVFRCATRQELEDCLNALQGRSWFRRHGALVQELVPPRGFDLRLIIAGGSVAGAAERVAPPGEWRTNVSLGAMLRAAHVTPEASSRGISAARAIGADLVGVDLAPTDAGWVVLELNGAADFDERYRLGGASVYAGIAAALGLRQRTARRNWAAPPRALSAGC